MESLSLFLADADETFALGERLGAQAPLGQTIALVGALGAGKTALTRGIAQGFGVIAPEEVVSPTYALMFDHPARRGRLVHVDFYRLDSVEGLLGLGVEEALADEAALKVVEWADRIPEAIPPAARWLRLSPDGAGRRIESFTP